MTPKKAETFEATKSSDVRHAGTLFLFAGMEAVLIITLAEALYPGYSTHTNPLSDLGAIGAPTWLYFDPAVFVWGLCWSVGMYLLLRGTGRRWMMVLNILPGTGFMLAALSPENFILAIHIAGAGLAFIPGSIAMLLSYRLVNSNLRYFSLFLGGLSAVAVVIYFRGYNSSLVQNTLGSGGAERIIVYPLLVWLIALGSYFLSLRMPASVPS